MWGQARFDIVYMHGERMNSKPYADFVNSIESITMFPYTSVGR